MNQSNEERLQQMLCAYVLNEASDADRQEVEAALADSEELRAEKARFESTIALVAGVYEGEEKLSEASMAELNLAASNRGGRVLQGPWYGKASVRVAAALVFVVGAFGMVKLLDKDNETKRDDLVAKAEFEMRREGSSDADDRLKELAKNERVLLLQEDGSSPRQSLADNVPLERRAADIEVKDAQGAVVATTLGKLEVVAEAPEPGGSLDLGGVIVTGLEYDLSQYESPPTEATDHASSSFVGRVVVDEPAAEDLNRLSLDAKIGGYKGPSDQVVPGISGAGASGPTTPGPSPTAPVARAKMKKGLLRSSPSSELPKSAKRPAAKPLASAPATTGRGLSVGTLKELEALGYADHDDLALDAGLADGSDDFFGGLGDFEDADGGEAKDQLSLRFRDDARRQRIALTADEITAVTNERCGLIIRSCRPRPNESPRDMFFRYYGDNPFVVADQDKFSTFAADVDTSSYVLVRNYLKNRQLPTKAQVRTEEFVNYFRPDVEAPTEGVFNIVSELAPSRFSAQPGRWMLRVAVRGREVSREERKPLNLTFVTDTSGSMKEQNRMELVKHALRLLVTQLDARDSISIVGFSTEATVLLPMTSAANRGVIESAIYKLQPDGGTNPEAGLLAGYAIAAQALSLNSHNRVVLLSDGVGNIGETDQNRLTDKVKAQRELGIYLNTIGVGMNNHNDEFLEQLANKGDGLSNYIDDELEARRALVENFTGAFEPIARDVKIQVEFDSAQVYRYRQLGYENRAIADKDFRNDKVDAGEIGAGHQVVCLYEIELDPSYNGDSAAPLATVRLRYKEPTGAGRHPAEDSATEITHTVRGGGTSFEGTSAGFRRSVIAAQFAEILRRSEHARGDSITDVIAAAAKLAPEIRDTDFQEMLDLMSICRGEILKRNQRRSDLDDCVQGLRRHNLRVAQYEPLGSESDQVTTEDLAKLGADLEESIRRVVRKRIEAAQAEVHKVR